MNDYELNNDFNATIDMARQVARYYGDDRQAVLQWWNTPQENLGGITPYMEITKYHGKRITDFCESIRKTISK